MLPRSASGSRLQVGLRQAPVTSDGDPYRDADHRPVTEHRGIVQIEEHVGPDGRQQDDGDDDQARALEADARGVVLHDGLQRMLLARGEHSEDERRRDGCHIGVEHLARGHAGDPHHRGGGVADHAAGAAGVARRDDAPPGSRCARACCRARAPWRPRSWRQRCCRGSWRSRRRSAAGKSRPSSRPGRKRGNRPGTPLRSKWSASRAKPSSSPSRLASVTHSCDNKPASPAMPVTPEKSPKPSLYSVITANPVSAT